MKRIHDLAVDIKRHLLGRRISDADRLGCFNNP